MARQKSKVKRRDLRIMWNSNGFWTNSGYAVQTRDLLKRFIADGWNVAHIAFYGLEGSPVTIDGIKVYPKISDIYGADAMVNHGKHWKADVMFSMQDVFTLNRDLMKQVKNWVPYTPIDQEPVPPGVLDSLRLANRIVTFSMFGQKALEKKGFASTLILEGVDTDIFKPMDQNECRKILNLPQDAFFFGMISANKDNPPRKGYQEILEAFALFCKDHPEARFLFHTQQMAPTGFPIVAYAEELGIKDKLHFVNAYQGTFHSRSEDIAKELNAVDVVMNASQTEGFGLVITEGQACGKPVIVNNCMSMPELVIPGKTGEICDTNYKRYSLQQSFVYTADVKSLHEKMEKIYQTLKKNPDFYKEATRKNIVDNYNIDTLYEENWKPFLEDLQEDLLTTNK